ncbi:hypothetical protein vseg_005122 [Gypsophila vaccaria]
MAYIAPCKRFALVILIILVCLISSSRIIIGARNLQAMEINDNLRENNVVKLDNGENEDNHGGITSNNDNEGLVVMDYSPVRQYTPIHHHN